MQKGTGRLVTAGLFALWFIANVHCAHRGFVVGGTQRGNGLRGSLVRGHNIAGGVEYQHYTKDIAGQTTMPAFNWTTFVSMVAAFGLVVGVLSTPVHAEEVGSETTVVKKKKKAKKVESSSSEGGGVSLPSFGGQESKPATVTAGRPVDYSVDISPTLNDDDLDKDTKITDRNYLGVAVVLLGPSFIFIAFWILGSLDII